MQNNLVDKQKFRVRKLIYSIVFLAVSASFAWDNYESHYPIWVIVAAAISYAFANVANFVHLFRYQPLFIASFWRIFFYLFLFHFFAEGILDELTEPPDLLWSAIAWTLSALLFFPTFRTIFILGFGTGRAYEKIKQKINLFWHQPIVKSPFKVAHLLIVFFVALIGLGFWKTECDYGFIVSMLEPYKKLHPAVGLVQQFFDTSSERVAQAGETGFKNSNVRTSLTNPQLDALFRESDNLLKIGKFEEAAKKASGSLKLATQQYKEPNVYTAESHHRIALAYQRGGNFKEAEKHYLASDEIFSRLTPSEPRRVLNLSANFGELYFGQGKFDLALMKFQRVVNALEVYPDFKNNPLATRLLCGLAACYLGKVELDEAEKLYHEIIAINEDIKMNSNTSLEASWIGLAGIEVHRKNLDTAERLYRKALESLERRNDKDEYSIKEMISTAKMSLSEVLKEKGNKPEAEKLLSEARAKLEGNWHSPYKQAEADFVYAHNLFLEGQYDKAQPLLEKLIEKLDAESFDPDHVINPINTLVQIYIKKNEHEKAKPLLERAALPPKNQTVAK